MPGRDLTAQPYACGEPDERCSEKIHGSIIVVRCSDESVHRHEGHAEPEGPSPQPLATRLIREKIAEPATECTHEGRSEPRREKSAQNRRALEDPIRNRIQQVIERRITRRAVSISARS